MTGTCESCPHERVHNVEYRALTESLRDLKERVMRLETMLTRGVLLVVANLAAMIVALAQGFFGG